MVKNRIQNRVNNSFQTAIAAKEGHSKIQQLQQKIQKLDAEAIEREQLLAQLRSQLEQQSGKFSVFINQIKPSQQCRVTFTSAMIDKRCESLRTKGQLEPLILIAAPNETKGFYYLEDGEVTWRAACKLVETGHNDWSRLDAVFSNLTEEDNIHRRTLIHHLHSESLTPLDRAEAVVREIALEVDSSTIDVVKLLRNIKYRFEKEPTGKSLLKQLEREGVNSIQDALIALNFSDRQIQILSFLRELQINFNSFVANDLNMVKLSDDLKNAARTQDLGCHLAKILNQLQPKKLNCSESVARQIRLDATQKVLQENFNETDTRKMVSEIIIERSQSAKKTNDSEGAIRIYQTTKENLHQLSINQLKPRQLKSLQRVMEQKLTAIKNQLDSLEN
ncbi:putative ParB-like partition protein [Hyella patelloides LEGE 07179]|uniref:Putative ParB-like partition protein n=1 Tax=Hyella patelloides LEGE 07179 TaxID=945734 RepID=A0A563VZJ0_9CYAN|nr:hypothetical protein [Hyella patelloides]VEP16787.1 putative ParB-like partition protein [Hyella patelloides LEGE 07179]